MLRNEVDKEDEEITKKQSPIRDPSVTWRCISSSEPSPTIDAHREGSRLLKIFVIRVLDYGLESSTAIVKSWPL